MNRCLHCGRRLRIASESGYGPTCLRNLFGAKPKRTAKQPVARDSLTPDMFAEVTA